MQRWVDAGLLVLFGSLVGARAVFVAVDWGHFQANPFEIIAVWSGGLTWAGALAGGLLALPFAARAENFTTGQLADGLLPLALPLTIAVWLGAWQSGSAYGPLAAGQFWAIPARDEWGVLAARFPLQLIGALATLALFAGLDALRAKFKAPGQLASVALLGLSLILLAASFLRADPAPTWRGLRLETWACLAFGLFAVLAWLSPLLRRLNFFSMLLPQSSRPHRQTDL